MVLQHNLVSMFSGRQLGITGLNKTRSTEKLSSGYRINKAADDAAGLAISEKMRSQVRGLMRASDNCQDGISLIQTADGALDQDHAMVQRIRELCVQASNDAVLTPEDQKKIQDEVNEVVKEIDRVADDTEFNKKKLLDGSYGNVFSASQLPFIKNMDGNIVSPQEVDSTDGLKLIYVEITNEYETEQTQTGMKTMPGYDNMKSALKNEIVPQALQAIISAFPAAFGDLASSTVGIGLKLYNDPESTTMAYAGISFWTDGQGNIVKDNQTYTLAVNLGYLDFDSNGNLSTDINASRGRSALETTIVHEMMHSIMQESMTNGMIGAKLAVRDPANEFPDWFIEGTAQAAAGAASPYNNWLNNAYFANDATDAQISQILTAPSRSLLTDTSASRYCTGYLASMYLASKVGGGEVSEDNIRSGMDAMLKRIRDGESLNDVAASLGYNGLSDFEEKFGNEGDSIQFVRDLVAAIKEAGGGGGLAGGFANKDILADNAISPVLFELDTEVDTVHNFYPDASGRFTDGGRGDGLGSGTPGGVINGEPFPVPAPKEYKGEGEWLQVGANAGQGILLRIADMHADAMGLTNLSVSGHVAANGGIIKCDNALSYISKERSKLGAYQNRLEYAIKIDDISAENLQGAESRIRDTDMSEEMTRFAKENILEQAGFSMLSQANQQGQMVLQLIG